jgi:hypothetical protein
VVGIKMRVSPRCDTVTLGFCVGHEVVVGLVV